MNRVLLTGRLTRDPEMRVVTNGKNVTQLSIGYCRRTRSGHPRSGISSTSVERSGEGAGGRAGSGQGDDRAWSAGYP